MIQTKLEKDSVDYLRPALAGCTAYADNFYACFALQQPQELPWCYKNYSQINVFHGTCSNIACYHTAVLFL